MRRIPSLAMYGFGYGLGQYFCCRYMVSYGLAIALTKFDRIDAPNPPKCIGRIHLYSHMWRYFDQGLHDFLFRWILYRILDSLYFSKDLLLISCFPISFETDTSTVNSVHQLQSYGKSYSQTLWRSYSFICGMAIIHLYWYGLRQTWCYWIWSNCNDRYSKSIEMS